jgi:hypothetical protein
MFWVLFVPILRSTTIAKHICYQDVWNHEHQIHFTKFTTKNNNQIEININNNNIFIPTIVYTNILGLTVDCSLT